MLAFVKINVVILIVVSLGVIMLNVMAPFHSESNSKHKKHCTLSQHSISFLFTKISYGARFSQLF